MRSHTQIKTNAPAGGNSAYTPAGALFFSNNNKDECVHLVHWAPSNNKNNQNNNNSNKTNTTWETTTRQGRWVLSGVSASGSDPRVTPVNLRCGWWKNVPSVVGGRGHVEPHGSGGSVPNSNATRAPSENIGGPKRAALRRADCHTTGTGNRVRRNAYHHQGML